MEDQTKASSVTPVNRWPLYVALGLLVIFAAIFVIVFVSLSNNAGTQEAAGELTAETYMDIVTPLLANANPENAEVLLVQYDCAACHRQGVANNLAPSFVGMAERAAEARPPLTAAAYIYEAIVHPLEHTLGGYTGIMPQYYGSRLSDQELGDIIAYLLTPDAQ